MSDNAASSGFVWYPSEAFKRESNWNAAVLADAVVRGLGGSFRPKQTLFVHDLPRTRNMKTMRRVIRAVLLDDKPGDLSALVNPEAVEELQKIVAATKS